MLRPISVWQERVHDCSQSHGFYHHEPSTDRLLMLIVGELSEAHEELRTGHDPTEIYYNNGSLKPEGFGIELADAVIRIMDTCEFLGIDLEKCIELKHNYNLSRPYKHGKVF